MLFKEFDAGKYTLSLRWKAARRSLAVIACASVVAGCSSMPTMEEMGQSISQTYAKVEASVRETYNETFNSDQPSDSDMASESSSQVQDDHLVSLSRSDVRHLQSKLAKLNFRPGPVDGVMGAKTVNAVKQYQAAHGMPVTGKITAGFLAHLDQKSAVGDADHLLTKSP